MVGLVSKRTEATHDSLRFAKEDDTPKQGDSGSEDEIGLKSTACGSTYLVLPRVDQTRGRGVLVGLDPSATVRLCTLVVRSGILQARYPSQGKWRAYLRGVLTFCGAFLTSAVLANGREGRQLRAVLKQHDHGGADVCWHAETAATRAEANGRAEAKGRMMTRTSERTTAAVPGLHLLTARQGRKPRTAASALPSVFIHSTSTRTGLREPQATSLAHPWRGQLLKWQGAPTCLTPTTRRWHHTECC